MTTPSAPRISEDEISDDELDLDPAQALGVALSVQAGSMLMEEAQDRAPAMLAHLQAMGYDVVPVAATRSAPAAGLDVERLAKGLCANRPPALAEDIDMFVDDECRTLARKVAREYAALAAEEVR